MHESCFSLTLIPFFAKIEIAKSITYFYSLMGIV